MIVAFSFLIAALVFLLVSFAIAALGVIGVYGYNSELDTVMLHTCIVFAAVGVLFMLVGGSIVCIAAVAYGAS